MRGGFRRADGDRDSSGAARHDFELHFNANTMGGNPRDATDFAMNPFDYILAGALIPLLCMLLGVWIWRHRERNNLAAAGREKAAMLEAARREAEAIAREARLAANEETLKLRSETEKRLNEREGPGEHPVGEFGAGGEKPARAKDGTGRQIGGG